ncbi:MAG TPA: hypothetical protein VJV75_14155 [Candidatus Polarisedimenticolia bacterium]|nr:hypothetical protein [Candidatus Polarisedimenticolia bacterium]
MRRLASVLPIFLCLALPALAAPGDAAGVRLSTLTQAGLDRQASPAAIADGPGAVLAALAGAENFPSACATPILLAPEKNEPGEAFRSALALLAAAPVRPDERVIPTRDGRFALHALLTPARESGHGAESVARISEALQAARAYLTGTLGFADPAPGPERLAVYLVRLGHGVEGYAVPAGAVGRGAAPFVVLDAALPADRVMPAALHQLAHLAIVDAAHAEAWWQEATASYLTLAATGDVEAQRPALAAALASPADGLLTDALAGMPGNLLWPLFLAERTGDPDVVRQIWLAMAESAVDPLEAADQILRRQYGLDGIAALRERAIWSLYTGSRADGLHFAAARSMPEAAFLNLAPALPITLGPIDSIEPAGSLAFRLPSDHSQGSLLLEARGDGGRPGIDLLVFYPGESQPALIPVPFDGPTGRVLVPWVEAREAWIILRNDAFGPRAEPTRFDVHLGRNPLAPFDLAAFTATPLGRGVSLEWTTASEEGLLGWNVLRASDPTGPFTRINAVAVPAMGDGRGDTGYLFVDESARAGRRYYYALEGVTVAGLSQRTHVTSARVAAR